MRGRASRQAALPFRWWRTLPEGLPAGCRRRRLKDRPARAKMKRLAPEASPDTSGGIHGKRDSARKLSAAGVNPSGQRKAEKTAGEGCASNSLEVVASKWHARQSVADFPFSERLVHGTDAVPFRGSGSGMNPAASELSRVECRRDDEPASFRAPAWHCQRDAAATGAPPPKAKRPIHAQRQDQQHAKPLRILFQFATARSAAKPGG